MDPNQNVITRPRYCGPAHEPSVEEAAERAKFRQDHTYQMKPRFPDEEMQNSATTNTRGLALILSILFILSKKLHSCRSCPSGPRKLMARFVDASAARYDVSPGLPSRACTVPFNLSAS